METTSVAPFSVALAVPAHRSALLLCMLENAVHELRTRGIRCTVARGSTADVTIRQRPAAPGAVGSDDLYADMVRGNGSSEHVRFAGPLRSAAMVSALARVARCLRAGPSDTGGSEAALHLLEAYRLHADSSLLELSIGRHTVALLDPHRALWHSVIGTATPDIEILLDRMTREETTLVPARGTPATAGVPLKPLLWQLGLTAGVAGLLPSLSRPGELRLKGWPYLAAGGPRSFGDMIRHLRSAPMDLISLREQGLAPRAELQGFLNACHACGYLETIPPPAAFGQRSRALPGVLPTSTPKARRLGRSAGVLASIRRSLGIGAE